MFLTEGEVFSKSDEYNTIQYYMIFPHANGIIALMSVLRLDSVHVQYTIRGGGA